ncbi:MAG: shikimate kinase [Deltaproteobacteria bacterium]|jgi:shikimate kinase|nr:shikimate kinase [Deltaproteobacteria bacterium]
MRSGCPLNITLIGMPGAGKSTVGVVLAKRLGYHFLDTDLLLQAEVGQRLQEIIYKRGMDRFKALEEHLLCGLQVRQTVIATGGSAIYSGKAMAHLQSLGQIVYLDISLEELERRIDDMDSRGLIIDVGESFNQLYHRRKPLYQRYADVTVDGSALGIEEVAAQIELNVCRSPDNPEYL